MNKAQQKNLQNKAREFNGLFAKWRKDGTKENYILLEGAIDALSDCLLEVKNGTT